MKKHPWIKEFYPITAKEAAQGSWVEAIKHSIRKWQGLTKSNLKKHGLSKGSTDVILDSEHKDFMRIDGDTCACCIKSSNSPKNGPYLQLSRCYGCPLVLIRKVSCDISFNDTKAPYLKFMYNGDPKPMLKLLKKALAYAKKHKL